MLKSNTYFSFLLISFLCWSCSQDVDTKVHTSGTLMQGHKITLLCEGPETHEQHEVNPFLDYRLEAEFSKEGRSIQVPGFFAADGNAAETSADSGNVWMVIFRPDEPGEWKYSISFRQGKSIAISNQPGIPAGCDGAQGSISVLPNTGALDDPFTKGKIVYDGSHYLKYSGKGSIFLKGGADSPENFLAFADFDGTNYHGDGERRVGEAGPNQSLHTYQPHEQDWREGDPTWQGGKGKGIIGALNYLSSQGMNSVYMLTNNIQGDGNDVFPWTAYESDFTRFDVSKLAQWELVFDHMDRLGLMCHFVTQETENELLLDQGNVGPSRKLYYRELIARFSHHLGVTWNLGEENGVAPWVGYGQNDQQRKDMSGYIAQLDPYPNLIVVHTLPNHDLRDSILNALIEFPHLRGVSLQTHPHEVHAETEKWYRKSELSGHTWVVCSDEIGPANTGVKPDADDPEHNEIRQQVLWGNLMAGGGGVEWYFGYEYAHNDLQCEDWRSRENMWRQTKIALDFFGNVPLEKLKPRDQLAKSGTYTLASMADDYYIVYIPSGGKTTLQVNPSNSYELQWFNPREGGALITQEQNIFTGKQALNLEIRDVDQSKDWVAVVTKH